MYGIVYGIIAVLLFAAVVAACIYLTRPDLPAGVSGAAGRLQANEVYVAAKSSGRIAELLVAEGAIVEAGQVVARMDTTALDAQLNKALAQILEADNNRRAAQSQVAARRAEARLAAQQERPSLELAAQDGVDLREEEVDTASILASRARVTRAEAEAARTRSAVETARATADRLRAQIADAVLVAPIRGRVQARLAEPGDALAGGDHVFSLLDLSDVYMNVFLPEAITGKLRMGMEARIALESAPDRAIPAFVSYVSPIAQASPKAPAAAKQRQDRMFRVKLQAPRERVREYEQPAAAGQRGVGYVRFDETTAWPARLEDRGAPSGGLWRTAAHR